MNSHGHLLWLSFSKKSSSKNPSTSPEGNAAVAPLEEQHHKPVDPVPLPDDDDDYESDIHSSTSLSSVRNYVIENGRRYHKYHERQYAFPNDDKAQSGENMNYVNLSGGRLHFAPIVDYLQNIIDLGTGTGTGMGAHKRLLQSR
ncbi:hypothetical protein B7494_g448 [Chlorociboria aeruginascens]|nr:hypothetical protein B7494_g448 [Chlorociboria aeruginascens]